ncbi:MAG: right-handed parallel beta-helix repeat-containing protein [Planctomycetota bacterium]
MPSEFASIQTAIDAAADGDTILVAPGTYQENLRYGGRSITVKSETGARATVVDGGLQGSVVRFDSGEGPESVLEGFTLTRGSGTTGRFELRGGGILCFGSSPTVRGNIITGNSMSWGHGGGIFCQGGAPHIEADSIEHNEIDGRGGGIYAEESQALIEGNRIEENSASYHGGGIYVTDGELAIRGNKIIANESWWGGGIDVIGPAMIEGNIIVWNYAHAEGGGLRCDGDITLVANTITENYVFPFGGSGIYWAGGDGILKASIVWGNGYGLYDEISVESGSLSVTYSDVRGGWPGIGNIDADPLLVRRWGERYALAPDSPCIDGGGLDSSPATWDLLGTPRVLDGNLDGRPAIDMGALEFGHIRIEVHERVSTMGVHRAPGCEAFVIGLHGSAGMPAYLFVGAEPGEVVHPKFGPLYLDLSAPWLLVPSGSLPSVFAVAVPPDFPTPVAFVLQGLALTPAGSAGNTSNQVTLLIE